MRLKSLAAPPLAPGAAPAWRDLIVRGRLVQRGLWTYSKLRGAAEERGLWITTGETIWRHWDETGALRPVAFDLGELNLDLWPPREPGNTVFRDEDGESEWRRHTVDEWGAGSVHARYSPWQMLLMRDVVHGAEVELPVSDLLQPDGIERWRASVGSTWRAMQDVWCTVNRRWEPTIKLLSELEARYWPAVSGRVSWPYAPGRGRVDPVPSERRAFDPAEVIARHGLEPEALAALYDWLAYQGARIEGGDWFKTVGGDRWGRLRLLAARDERRRIKGPLRLALDYYEAAEMLNRCWFDMAGTYLPGVEVAPYRSRSVPVDAETVTGTPYQRGRRALRDELVSHGLWFGPVHAIVEGDTEALWVRRLTEKLLGWTPDELVVTNLRGVGGAQRIRDLVATIADYASHSVLLVDAEGQMTTYVRALVERSELDERDVMMVRSSFEEENFSDAELLRVVRRLAANPPGQRPVVRVRLTTRQLRAEHRRRCAAARRGEAPGLANTLLSLLAESAHGPVRLSKIELAKGLIDLVVRGLEDGTKREREQQRPVVAFVARRVATPLGVAAFM